jgi:hypothetical protein
MALVLNDRVKETSTSTGTGTVNLAGAEVGFETFVAGIGNTNTTYYAIVHQTAAEFEVGLGTVSDSTPDTLSRTTILSSSNSDSAVDFSAGTKDVFCTLPASKTVFEDASNNAVVGGTLTATTFSGALPYSDLTGTPTIPTNNNQLTNGAGYVTSNTTYTAGTGLALSGTEFTLSLNTGNSLPNNAWVASAEGRNRFYFGTSSHTYFQTGNGYYYRNASDVDVFIVDSGGNGYFDGNVTAYYSDERLKDKQGKIENALDKVGQIETFYFKENELAKSLGHTVDKKQVGVSAQSVYEVLPEIVDLAPFDTDHETGESKSGEDYMTVDYAKLTPLLIEAIKEQQKQIETLTAKVKKLEDK